MIVAGVLVVALIAALLFVPPFLERRSAEDRYAAAVEERNAAASDYDDQRTLADDGRAVAGEALEVADAVATDEAEPYLDPDGFDTVREIADELRSAPAPDPQGAGTIEPETYDTVEAYTTAAEALEDEAAALREDADALAEAATLFDEKAPQLDTAVAELRAEIPDRADQIEKDNISSEARVRIDLQYAADFAATSEDHVAYYIGEYAAAAAAVEDSQASEIAEKDQGDGHSDTRLEVEEFVRSIVGDARVDFDWAPIVNGLGEGVSAGGYVEWHYLDGGYATMELSNSVAAYWPDPRFEGLVAHEAGHVITSQCQDLLNDTFEGDAELMATSWAIGMGFDNPWGNGVDFYLDGVPPEQELIDATKSCR
ncbi:hypothetical protein [Microbacterium gubbeenense]|uniref:hypothetical protein n=1 Tax=Microbacterium gubbeenense TaxID=159896 RepID=UPI003F99E9B4